MFFVLLVHFCELRNTFVCILSKALGVAAIPEGKLVQIVSSVYINQSISD